jgi:hypothetical protein
VEAGHRGWGDNHVEKKGENEHLLGIWVGIEPTSSGTWNMFITTLSAMPLAATVYFSSLTPFPLGIPLFGLEHVLSWLH